MDSRRLVRQLLDEVVQIVPLSFNGPGQGKLNFSTFEIVLCTFGAEVVISGEMVCEKADAQFKRDQSYAIG